MVRGTVRGTNVLDKAAERSIRRPHARIRRHVASCSTSTFRSPGGICPPGRATSGTSAGPSSLQSGPCKCARYADPCWTRSTPASCGAVTSRAPAGPSVTCALIQEAIDETTTALAAVGVTLAPSAFLFSNDPAHSRPWNPDWVSHRVCDLAQAAGADLDIKGIRHYTASQLLAAGFDLGNTAARLGHSGGGATTLKHYADPVSEVDRRAAAYLAQLTTTSAAQSG
jgi:hypothetical protein